MKLCEINGLILALPTADARESIQAKVFSCLPEHESFFKQIDKFRMLMMGRYVGIITVCRYYHWPFFYIFYYYQPVALVIGEGFTRLQAGFRGGGVVNGRGLGNGRGVGQSWGWCTSAGREDVMRQKSQYIPAAHQNINDQCKSITLGNKFQLFFCFPNQIWLFLLILACWIQIWDQFLSISSNFVFTGI